MRFLFATDGFPEVEGTSSGSGIGTHLSVLTRGLIGEGHECHILSWGQIGASKSQIVDGVQVHLVTRGYWPFLERIAPGSRDVATRWIAARSLNAVYNFDWIEIQNQEGIDIGIQRAFAEKVIVRVHTTLAQMVDHKKISPTSRTLAYLARERSSLLLAHRLIVSTKGHAEEIERLFPLRCNPQVVPLGLDAPRDFNTRRCSQEGSTPSFLVVGTRDLRKGIDRLGPALDAYARQFGPCRCVVVSSDGLATSLDFGLDKLPETVEMIWRSTLSSADLLNEYLKASAILHLSRYESFGYPPVEAASLAVPIVATPTGAAIHLLSDELSRFLVDGDNPTCVAEAMAEAVLRPEVGLLVQLRYRSLYTGERMLESYLKALESWSRENNETRGRWQIGGRGA